MRRAVLTIVLLSLARPAVAEDKAACRASFDEAQTLRDAGKLTAARERMLLCTKVCPSAFAKVCDGWIVDVDKSLPTLSLRAVDEHGQDLVHVTVTLDGKPLVAKLDGKAIAIDPGNHVLRFTATGKTPVEKAVVVVEGEKDRAVLVTLPAPLDAAPKPKQPQPQTESAPIADPPKAGRVLPVAAYVVTGLGVVAFGGFAYFGLKGDADHRALVASCSPTASCTQEDKDHVLREWRTADVFLASGVVLIGVGAALYFTHDKSSAQPSVSLAPTRSGGHAAFSFRF